MMIKTLHFTFGVAAFGFVALQACSSSSPSTTTTDDDAETVVPTEAGAETSTTSPEAGSDAGAEAGCDITASNDACDMCAAASCCPQEDTCLGEALDDSGTTECAEIFSCVTDCASMDAGTFESCSSACSEGHPGQPTTDFNALATCLTTNCSTQCN